MNENIWNDKNLIKVLKENGVVVMPTDTIYGMVCNTLNKEAVLRVYKIRERNPKKSCIILIGNINELEKFGIFLSEIKKEELKKYWFITSENDGSRPTSIVLNCKNDSLEYLHHGTNTLAFRIPKLKTLRELLLKTGPLISPSANQEGFFPAKTVEEAKKYFGDLVDLYINGGELKNKASKLIKLNNDGSIIVLRE